MKKIWLRTMIGLILVLTQVVMAQAQEAKAYAIVTIIVPEQSQQTAKIKPMSEEKATAQETTLLQQEMLLAQNQD